MEQEKLLDHDPESSPPHHPLRDDFYAEDEPNPMLMKGSDYIFDNKKEVSAEHGDQVYKYEDTQQGMDVDCALSCAVIAVVSHSGLKATAFNLAKGMIGAGILALSQTFMWNGLGLNFILLSIVLVMNYLSSRLLIKSADKKSAITYEDTAMKCLGRYGAIAIDAAIIFRNFFGLTAYFVIIRDAWKGLLIALGYTDQYLLEVMLVYVLLTALPLSLLRNLKSLKYVSLASLFVMTFFAVGMFARFLALWNGGDGKIVWWHMSTDIFRSLPIQVFAATAQHVYFPIRMEMKDPRFKKFSISLMWAMGYTSFLYNFVGIIGYLTFLDEVKGNIVLNYGTAVLAVVMKMAVCFNITVSYPLNIRPVVIAIDFLLFHEGWVTPLTFGIVKPNKENWINDHERSMVRKLRATVVLFFITLLFSMTITDMSFLLGVSGSIAGAMMAFILPGLISFYAKPNPSPKRWASTIISISFGVFVAITGLMSTLYAQAAKK